MLFKMFRVMLNIVKHLAMSVIKPSVRSFRRYALSG